MNKEEKFAEAQETLRKAEKDYGTAESNLIKARRNCKEAEREYLRELFPDDEAVKEHFK